MARNPKLIRKGPHRRTKLPRVHGLQPTPCSVEELKEQARRVIGRLEEEGQADYHRAMARLEQLFPVARKGTPEGDEFEQLAAFITDWEKRH